MPPPGGYIVPTTWRDVIDAAMTVGRDAFAWLAAVPALAWRRSRRAARLCARTSSVHTAPRASAVTGYRLEPNVVLYLEGTGKTARALFAYRIGMTMAGACQSLLAVHAEAVAPPGAGPQWSPANGLPDLVGFHWCQPETWLAEAKGGKRTGLGELRNGALQLSAAGLMAGSHVRVLCGTSIEHRVFMTIDIEKACGTSGAVVPGEGGRPSPDGDDGELLALARSRMLNYYVL